MDENDDDPPPFWLQPTTTLHHVDRHHNHHRHRHVSSLFLNTGVLVMFLVVTAVIFLVIVIPSVVSLSRQLFIPSLVKSSWSSLNIVLVIFAIVCGFLSRKDDDLTPVNTPTTKDEYPEKMSDNNFGNAETLTRLRRSSSSYPDLRQESNWMIKENKWRFYDDTDVENHQFQRLDGQISSHTRSFRKMGTDGDQIQAKNIEVDTFVRKTQELSYESTSSSPSPSVIDEDETSTKNMNIPASSTPLSPKLYFWPSPPPPPPPPPRRRHSSIPTKKKTNQTFETIGYGRYKWNNTIEVKKPKSKVIEQPPPPPPPPPPRSRPVVVAHYRENNKQENSDRKRGGVNVTKDFFSSFYHQSKSKRKHKRRSYENLEDLIESPKTSSIYRSKSTPEFPPPHSVFHTIFSKKAKTRAKKEVKNVSFNTMDDDDDYNNGVRCNESPWRRIPPPPPPPPPPAFKMKPWKFVKIKRNNNNSSQCGYTSSEDESSSSQSPALLCSSSPDVNIKADDFIARFRAKLNLEKTDSLNFKQRAPSSHLRPGSI